MHPTEEIEANSIILYSNSIQPRHAGIFLGQGMVCSRWGKISTFRHQLWEVPSSYGTDVKYYHALQPSVAKSYFLKFAESGDTPK